jgi:hypothetical protein
MSAAFNGPMVSGLGAAKRSLSGLGSEVKTVAKFGLALGGSFSLATAAKDALSLQSQYKNMAFAIRAGTGEAVKWEDIQARIQTTALATHQANSDVANSFRDIQQETGNLKFTEQAIGAAGKMALITGEDIGIFSNLAGVAFEKFGIDGANVEDALSAIYSAANRGGLSLAEMSEKMGMLGASAKMLGMGGVDGMSRVIGMTQMADDSLGNMKQKIAAVTGLLDEMANPKQMKDVGKLLHVNLLDKKGNVRKDALDTVLSRTGGDAQKIATIASGPTVKLLTEFGKIYKEGADASGQKGKGKIQAGLDAFHAAMEKAAKSELDAAAREEQAKKQSDTAKSAMNDALNELTNAFEKPEMIAAMKSLAHTMPTLASGAAKLMEVTLNNPLLAGAGYVTVRGGGAMMGGMLSELGKGLTAAGTPTGSVMAKVFSTSVGASPMWSAGGVLFAAAAGFGIGKAIADATVGADTKEMGDTENALAVANATLGTGDKAQMVPALKAAKERLKQVQENPASGFTEAISDVASVITGGDTKTARQREADEIGGLKKVIAELESASGDTGDTTTKTNRALTVMATSAERVARVFNSMGGKDNGDGSHGPPRSPGNAPGFYAPQ